MPEVNFYVKNNVVKRGDNLFRIIEVLGEMVYLSAPDQPYVAYATLHYSQLEEQGYITVDAPEDWPQIEV